MGVSVPPQVVRQPPAAASVIFRELPAVAQAAALMYEGPYDSLPEGVLALLAHVGAHGHVVAGPLRELHLSGPAHEEQGAEDTPVIELQAPIAPAGDRGRVG